MITFLPIEKVTGFAKQYNINGYSNLFVGTEGSKLFVRNHYKVMDMPFVALHDKGGNLLKTYAKDIYLKDLSVRLNNLK